MIRINSSLSDTYADILPEIGGILTNLIFDGNEVITCPILGEDYKAGFPSAFLFPFPSRIENGKYSFEGKDYQLPINEPARGHAIHGFVAHQKFEIISQSDKEVSLAYHYAGDYEGYPFPFQFSINYKFINTSLSITYTAKNIGTGNMPCAFGWHPYFRLGQKVDNLSIKIPAAQIISLNEKMISNGKSETIPARTISLDGTSLDNGFYLQNEGDFAQTELIDEDKKLVVWQETGSQKLNYLVVYTPPNRQNVAIESLSSNINAFNNQEDLIVLKPFESVSGNIKVWLETKNCG